MSIDTLEPEKVTSEERRLVDDLIVHTLEQAGAAIHRTQELMPLHLRHHLSMNVVSGLTSVAILDWAYHLLQKLEPEEMPPPRQMMRVMHAKITEAQLEVLPRLIKELLARARSEQD